MVGNIYYNQFINKHTFPIARGEPHLNYGKKIINKQKQMCNLFRFTGFMRSIISNSRLYFPKINNMDFEREIKTNIFIPNFLEKYEKYYYY